MKVNSLALMALMQASLENSNAWLKAGGYNYPIPNTKNSNAAKQQRLAKKNKAIRAKSSKRRY